MKLIAMPHFNSVRIENGVLTVDRKFHLGMLEYCKHISARISTVHPVLMDGGPAIMDAIQLPLHDLPYEAVAVNYNIEDGAGEVGGRRQQRDLVARSSLVYGTGMGAAATARKLGVRYIDVLEYDLQTQIAVTTLQVDNQVRRVVRRVRCIRDYYRRQVPQMRGAYALHCNGYPVYDAVEHYNIKRLLYLDSRMSADMLMSDDELRQRLLAREGRQQPLRLLYSGRYERLKGADDAVRVAMQCLARGLDIELHCYGQGGLMGAMREIAAGSGRIHIHDAVSYPELAKLARTFDVFVCCHVQSDPSCTYLESFGAGLPVVGYGNRMWRRLCRESGAGMSSPVGKPADMVEGIARLASDVALLADQSRRALAFAREHCFQNEFRKRVDAINEALE